MNVYIINFNRLTWPKAMADWIATIANPVFIDNASTYPPLLEYYKSCPYDVIQLRRNLGRLAPWKAHVTGSDRYYAVTDPDLDLSGIPYDVFDVLTEGLVRYPEAMKAGVSLRIDDLPDTELSKKVIEWESKWWAKPLNTIWYDADVDTTLAVYDRERGDPTQTNRAVRSAPPYCARHLPWYGQYNGEEESYYSKTALLSETYWTRLAQEATR